MSKICSIYTKLFVVSILIVTAMYIVASEEDKQRKNSFTYIYHHKDVWKGTESSSGLGSTLQATDTLHCLLPALIKSLNIHIFLDAGCGDLNWIKKVPLGIDYYIGVDIVDELIEKNMKTYQGDWIKFECLDITKDPLPYADLIFCRDCLQHLSYNDIKAVINNFKASGSRYLLATTYFNLKENTRDIRSGNFHVVNLMKEPFNLPEPIISFDELSAEEDMLMWRKRMGIWRLSDIEFSSF